MVATLSLLDGPDFSASALHPAVLDFYSHTQQWRLDARVRWAIWAWPFGWLIAALFARRLDQLALPLRRHDVAQGMTSRVVPLVRDNHQVAAMWLRQRRTTGRVVFSGLYSIVELPDSTPVISVAFPLPRGRLVVLLSPTVTADGGLVLTSAAGTWGQSGAYLVVERASGCWGRRIPVHEQFHVYVDQEHVLRTDHRLDLGRWHAFHLHYRLTSLSA